MGKFKSSILKTKKTGGKVFKPVAGVKHKIVSASDRKKSASSSTDSENTIAQRKKENEDQEFGWSDLAKKDAVNSVSRASSSLIGTSYSLVSKEHENFVVGIYNIFAALSMLLMGATKNSNTSKEIEEILQISQLQTLSEGNHEIIHELKPKPTDKCIIFIADRWFVTDEGLLHSEYLGNCQSHYLNVPESTDFKRADAARGKINSWVDEKTVQKIKKVVESEHINSNTKAVFVSGLYFHGKLAQKFVKTEPQMFFLDTKPIMTPFMTCEGLFYVSELTSNRAHAIEIPYEDERMALRIVLPWDKTGLSDLEKQFEDGKLNFHDLHLIHKKKRKLSLPIFRISTIHNFKKILARLGMKTAFKKGDFEVMARSKDLRVDEMIQKMVIEIDPISGNRNKDKSEEGIGSVPFTCDHPFLFCIKDYSTGVILFHGRVKDPTVK